MKAQCFNFRKQILAAELRSKEDGDRPATPSQQTLPHRMGEGDPNFCRKRDPIGMLLDHCSVGQGQDRAEGMIWVSVVIALRITCGVLHSKSLPGPCACE